MTSRPSSSTAPSSGKSNPVRTFTSVDFPAPFGPMRPTTSCRCSSSVTSRSACTPSKARETPAARSEAPDRRISSGCASTKPLDLRDDLRLDRPDDPRRVVLHADHAVRAVRTPCAAVFEKLTRPERVGTFLNFSICAASAGPFVLPPVRLSATRDAVDRGRAGDERRRCCRPSRSPPAFFFASALTALHRVVAERRGERHVVVVRDLRLGACTSSSRRRPTS